MEAQGMFQNILLAEYHGTFCDILLLANLQNKFKQAQSRLRNRDRKPSRIDLGSFQFRFVLIRFEISISRFIDYFNFDFVFD
jgi:hypothetical protein